MSGEMAGEPRQNPDSDALARTVAALADDEDVMWRMGVREWDIVGDLSPGLRAEVIRQSREHVANLAAALSTTPARSEG